MLIPSWCSVGFTSTAKNGYYLESDFQALKYEARLIIQILFWPTIIIGIIGNLAVLCRLLLMPQGRFAVLKPFYRCALLSFAISDLLLLVASGSYTLSTIIHKANLLWKLPEWSCGVIPYLQTVAIFVGSFTLAAIAIDRYRALTPKYPATEGFKWPQAVSLNMLIWFIAMATSSIIIGKYRIYSFFVVREEEGTIYEGHLCITDQDHTALIYTALFVTIFLPLAAIFVTVHVLLALNIWRRQEHGFKSQLSSGNDSQATEFSTVSNNIQRAKPQPPARALTSNNVRRKKRTVNVILVLICAFLIGRLPVWIFLLFKLHTKLTGNIWPYVQICFSGLTLVNAALDPFLYAFLCEALSILTFLQTCRKRRDQVTISSPRDERQRENIHNIVPRGPYNL